MLWCQDGRPRLRPLLRPDGSPKLDMITISDMRILGGIEGNELIYLFESFGCCREWPKLACHEWLAMAVNYFHLWWMSCTHGRRRHVIFL